MGLGFLIFREMWIKNPIVNFRVLGERNLAMSCIMIFCAYAVLYGNSFSLPNLLQSLFGYDAYVSGLVLSPGGITSITALLVAGILLAQGPRWLVYWLVRRLFPWWWMSVDRREVPSRPMDARRLIATGLIILAVSNYWFSQLNLQIGPWQVIWPRMLLTLGLGLIFAPINVAAFKYTPVHLRGAAVGLLALLRNEGGSVGTSISQTIQERREQFHLSRLGESLNPLNPATNSYMQQAQSFFLQRTGDPAGSQQRALQTLDNLRQQQAASLAYFDVFWVCAVLAIVLVPLVLFMKRSVAEKGAHIGGE